MYNNILEKERISILENEGWLANLQAGILKGNGRDNLVLLFLQFRKGLSKETKKLLAEIEITSALEQSEQNRIESPNLTVTNFYLSFKGYEKLEIPINCNDSAFKSGLKERKEKDEKGNLVHVLGDDPEKWELHLKTDIHGILSLANDDIESLETLVELYKGNFRGIIEIVAIEFGKVYKNKNCRPIEHFGYVDGISQPHFFEEDVMKNVGKYWDPGAPLGLVLVDDFGIDKRDCYGSYMVFRKLEQDVKGFKEAEQKLANELKFVGNAEEVAGAMIIGRFENGLPVIKFGSTISQEVDNIDNDFDYSFDSEGSRCPFHSHIRKTNPRGDNQRLFGISEQEERSHRIVRRGITYGERDFDAKEYPSNDVGLLFICFQSDIAHQFEFIQRAWANNNDFPIPFTGIDPVIGQGENRKYLNGKPLEQQWRKSNREEYSSSFTSFVTMKGGEYFFAPSLPFFKSLTKTV